MAKGIVVLGAGGHARVVIETLVIAGRDVVGIFDASGDRVGEKIFGIPILGSDNDLPRLFDPADILLANGLGAALSLSPRGDLYRSMKRAMFRFVSVCHPSATVSPSATIGEGSQILAGNVTNCGVVIGENVILNTACVVDHDCLIGNHCHVAPSATLCGGVTLGESVFVGTGATVIQGVSIGDGAFIAAGAVVTGNVNRGSRVMGIPAREV